MNRHKTSKDILITGANGNIGKFLYNYLGNEYNIIPTSKSNQHEKGILSIDLNNLNSIKYNVENFPKLDMLIFLVGLAHKKGKGKELDSFRAVNVTTLVNLLSVLKEKKNIPKKIIFASTISVYGEKMNQHVYDESTNNTPKSPYAMTKLEAEEYLLEQFKDQSWILRFAPVYGGGFNLNINRRTKVGGQYYKVGNGQSKLSLCHLENICEAVLKILEDKVPAGVYNISDTNEYTYNDLLNFMDAKLVIPIPQNLVKALYLIGAFMNNTFLKENAIKLVTDNIFPSKKIRKYISINASLN